MNWETGDSDRDSNLDLDWDSLLDLDFGLGLTRTYSDLDLDLDCDNLPELKFVEVYAVSEYIVINLNFAIFQSSASLNTKFLFEYRYTMQTLKWW